MRNGIGGNGGPPLYGNDNGWIAVARSMRSHAVVGFHLFAKPCDPSRGAMQPALAWLDLLMECRYTAGEVMNNGRKMVLRRGQLLGANLWLAQRWNWTPKATRTWLAKLELHGMISFGDVDENGKNGESSESPSQGADESSKGRSKGRFANILTICNYDSYQLSATEERQVEKTFDGRLGAGCGQVAGRLTDIENARAKTKEQETREQGNQEVDAATTRDARSVAARSPANVPSVDSPQSTLLVPPAPVARAESDVDRLNREAYERGLRIKGGAAAKSARAFQRATGELDGSLGVSLINGRLSVANGVRSALQDEFSGIDFAEVCDRAAPEVMRFSYPTVDQAMTVIRKWARIIVSDQQKANQQQRQRPPSRDGTKRPTLGELQAAALEIEAEEAAKRGRLF